MAAGRSPPNDDFLVPPPHGINRRLAGRIRGVRNRAWARHLRTVVRVPVARRVVTRIIAKLVSQPLGRALRMTPRRHGGRRLAGGRRARRRRHRGRLRRPRGRVAGGERRMRRRGTGRRRELHALHALHGHAQSREVQRRRERAVFGPVLQPRDEPVHGRVHRHGVSQQIGQRGVNLHRHENLGALQFERQDCHVQAAPVAAPKPSLRDVLVVELALRVTHVQHAARTLRQVCG